MVFSLLLPGLGHVYAGDVERGLKCYLAWLLTAALLVVLLLTFPFGVATLPLAAAVILAAFAGIAADAARSARRASPAYTLRPYNRWPVYVGLWIAGSLAMDVARAGTRANLIEAYRIPAASMEPTLLIGDFLFVSKSAAGIRGAGVGSVVVFESVEEPGVFVIKRIAGLPGDTLAMRSDTLVRNGIPIHEPYVVRTDPLADRRDPQMYASQVRYFVGSKRGRYEPSLKNWGPLAIPADSVFVLGDNRHNSYDSRYFGPVAIDRLRGRPLRIYYSYDKSVARPLPMFTAIRWDRIGQKLAQ